MKELNKNDISEIHGGGYQTVFVVIAVAIASVIAYKKGEKDGYEANANC